MILLHPPLNHASPNLTYSFPLPYVDRKAPDPAEAGLGVRRPQNTWIIPR